jgi:hypothetical protein
MGEWRCSSTHFYLRHQMVVSGQLHASATLVGLNGNPSSHWTGVSVCLRISLNGIQKSLIVLAGNRDTVHRSPRLWPSHCTKHSNTPPPTSFLFCDNFSREKDREDRLANCTPLRAVVVIPLTHGGWNGKLRFVRILSISTKLLRWIKNISLYQYSVGPWTSYFLVLSGVFIVWFTTLKTGLIHVNCCFIYCRPTWNVF